MDQLTRLRTLRNKCGDAIQQLSQAQHRYRIAFGCDSDTLKEAMRSTGAVLTDVNEGLKHLEAEEASIRG